MNATKDIPEQQKIAMMAGLPHRELLLPSSRAVVKVARNDSKRTDPGASSFCKVVNESRSLILSFRFRSGRSQSKLSGRQKYSIMSAKTPPGPLYVIVNKPNLVQENEKRT